MAGTRPFRLSVVCFFDEAVSFCPNFVKDQSACFVYRPDPMIHCFALRDSLVVALPLILVMASLGPGNW